MRVRALRDGYYQHERRKKGYVFEAGDEFLNHPVDPKTGKRDKSEKKVLPDWAEDASKPVKKEGKKLPFPGAKVVKPNKRQRGGESVDFENPENNKPESEEPSEE